MREPPQKVVDGLTTKSAQIRALGEQGYSRSEIPKFLGVRYQHVNNVLKQSRIDASSETFSEALPIRIPPEPWPMQRLVETGFDLIGTCLLRREDVFEYSALPPVGPGVYAFAANEVIHYVGVTRRGLRTRLNHYIRGHERQRTSARVKGLILDALRHGQIVSVLIAMPPKLEWNGLPVDGAAGLEAGLISLIRPPWNQQGAS